MACIRALSVALLVGLAPPTDAFRCAAPLARITKPSLSYTSTAPLALHAPARSTTPQMALMRGPRSALALAFIRPRAALVILVAAVAVALYKRKQGGDDAPAVVAAVKESAPVPVKTATKWTEQALDTIRSPSRRRRHHLRRRRRRHRRRSQCRRCRRRRRQSLRRRRRHRRRHPREAAAAAAAAPKPPFLRHRQSRHRRLPRRHQRSRPASPASKTGASMGQTPAEVAAPGVANNCYPFGK